MIYFNRYVQSTSIKKLIPYYHELMGKIKEHEGKILETDDYALDKVLDKTKEKIALKNLMILKF